MNDAALRALLPTRITRGALLRPDLSATGLVRGGAPAWELLPAQARARIGGDFHRLLLALDAPLDVYVVDQVLDVEREIAELHARRERARHPLLAEALTEIAGYLADLGESTGSRAKQVVWAVTVEAAVPGAASHAARAFARPKGPHRSAAESPAGHAVLTQAVERARRLVEGLRALGGTPPPRLMEAEEIARLVYERADPVRASRYPLTGALLNRVRRVVVVEKSKGWPE